MSQQVIIFDTTYVMANKRCTGKPRASKRSRRSHWPLSEWGSTYGSRFPGILAGDFESVQTIARTIKTAACALGALC
ncbi:hypothetical protein MJ563_04750 [Klebsiella pneumoniae]|nr:hypothetical protein MJ563_04750 [Klebsiella pneumoniae]